MTAGAPRAAIALPYTRPMSSVPAAASASARALLVGTACYLLASLFWGMNIPMTAILFRTFDPIFLAPVRVAIAAAVLLAITLALHGRGSVGMGTSFLRLAGMTLAMSLFYVLYNLGLRYTNTITAAAIMAGGPVYSAVVLRLAFGMPLERGFWGAALLTLVGAGIAVYGRASDTGQGLTLQGGEPLILLSMVCWTVYSLWSQRWFDPKVPQLRRTYAAMVGSALWLFLFWVFARAVGMVGPPELSPGPDALAWLAITAVFATALGGVAWNIGVNRIGLAAGTLWQNTVPVFAVLISLLFGIVPTLEQVIGGAIVISGVLYMQWRRSRP